ncbi:ECF transporter S component [Lachnoclostridium sp. MSJ-17]|uniref:ECF transporter S component n=1 Tax=Lachnoclostridium sp. MSJ-17 TaxID=2841516 RepID=UPI001C10627D|nr:ECF transporter S component [Lachnoclostridium sp. MSJ-17]MBU5461131.1 ECF transporter S component [Lachnoclostridium sp. MSJ-17]
MKKQNTNSRTFTLVGLAILTAIIIVLQVVTTYFPTKPFAITLALIPIVIGSALYGAKAGAYLGAVFSIVVLIMCAAGADAGGAMVFYANPAMCIVLCLLKGSAAGFVAGLVYNAVSKKNQILGAVLAAFCAPVVNTGIFIAGLLLFFRDVLAQWAGDTDILFFAIIGLTGVNFLVELGVNMILCPVIVKVVNAVRK